MQSRNCKLLSVVWFLERGSQPTADRGPPYTLACLPNTLAKEHYDKQSRIFTLPTNEKFPDPKPRYKQTRLPSVVALSLSLSNSDIPAQADRPTSAICGRKRVNKSPARFNSLHFSFEWCLLSAACIPSSQTRITFRAPWRGPPCKYVCNNHSCTER